MLVGEADSSEGIDVGFGHRSRGQGELDGVVEDGPGLGIQVCLGVVVDDVASVIGVAGVLTEEPSVGDGSITAAVHQRDHRGDGFLLGTGQGGRSEGGVGVEVLNRRHEVGLMDMQLITEGTATSVSRIQDMMAS